MRLNLLLLSTLFWGLFAVHSVHANTQVTEKDFSEAFDALSVLDSIPEVLRKPLLRSGTKESYLSQIMGFLRKKGVEKTKLTLGGLKERRDSAILKARQNQISMILKYDTNFDAQVTIQEAKTAISKSLSKLDEKIRQKRIDTNLNSIKPLDTNKDNIISYKEMSILSEETQENVLDRSILTYKQYLDLDPNKDGMLTSYELEELARKSFDVLDKNKDGMVSSEEIAPYKKAYRTLGISPRNHISRDSCYSPRALANLKTVSIGVHKGDALSNVTTAGQEEITTSITVKVEDDQPPTYLILSSYAPVIWQFKGNTDAIKHVIVGSSTGNRHNKSGSGVVGIKKSNITFERNNCLPHYYKADISKLYGIKGYIRRLIGRVPDSIDGIYNTTDVIISNESTKFFSVKEDVKNTTHASLDGDNSSKASGKNLEGLQQLQATRGTQQAQKGFDLTLWNEEVVRSFPAGVTSIDPDEVVSYRKAELYEVLPQMVGIAKLVHDGFIEVISNREFRIIKDIPRFPIGLIGAHSVKFIIASGVKKPEGSAGHSCVILEETGEANNKVRCRGASSAPYIYRSRNGKVLRQNR